MRKRHITFLDHIKSLTNLSYSAIAREAGVSETTLTRFISKENFDSLSQQTLDKVAKVGGYNNYEDFLLTNKFAGNPVDVKQVEISDAQKFEIYEAVKRVLSGVKGSQATDIKTVTDITTEVIKTMKLLNTKFVTDSLILYVIESDEN